MTLHLSRQRLEAILKSRQIKSNDLKAIDQLFGGADGYYWYHTLRQMSEDEDEITWDSEQAMRDAVQGHENATAAEDEVKPQALGDAHVAAIAKLLAE